MDSSSFEAALERLTLTDVRRLAADLDEMVATVADEIATTRAIIALEQSVRRAGVSAHAAMAAARTSRIVGAIAENAGVDMPDPDVVRVARAAGQIARGFVAAPEADAELAFLLGGFARMRALAVAR